VYRLNVFLNRDVLSALSNLVVFFFSVDAKQIDRFQRFALCVVYGMRGVRCDQIIQYDT